MTDPLLFLTDTLTAADAENVLLRRHYQHKIYQQQTLSYQLSQAAAGISFKY